jgi:hypothetical protein
MADFSAMTLGGLLSQLPLGFQFDQLHQLFKDQITLEFLAFLFAQRALTLNMDEFVGSRSNL